MGLEWGLAGKKDLVLLIGWMAPCVARQCPSTWLRHRSCHHTNTRAAAPLDDCLFRPRNATPQAGRQPRSRSRTLTFHNTTTNKPFAVGPAPLPSRVSANRRVPVHPTPAQPRDSPCLDLHLFGRAAGWPLLCARATDNSHNNLPEPQFAARMAALLTPLLPASTFSSLERGERLVSTAAGHASRSVPGGRTVAHSRILSSCVRFPPLTDPPSPSPPASNLKKSHPRLVARGLPAAPAASRPCAAQVRCQKGMGRVCVEGGLRSAPPCTGRQPAARPPCFIPLSTIT